MNMLIKRFELLSSWQRALLLAGSGLFALAVTREVAGVDRCSLFRTLSLQSTAAARNTLPFFA